MSEQIEAIATTAARLIVEDGMEWGPAKRQALTDLDLPSRTPLPDNLIIEDAVRAHISIFCPDTQRQAMVTLLKAATAAMRAMSAHQPYLTGAVWRGLATAQSDIYIQLFCDDAKMAEIDLINQGVPYETTEITGFRGEPVVALTTLQRVVSWTWPTAIHWVLYDADDLRGALKPGKGRRDGMADRGDLKAVERLLAEFETEEGA
jgi:hypothetical protein